MASSIVRAQTIAGSPQIINTYVGGIFNGYTSSGYTIKSNRFVSLQPTGAVNTSFNPWDSSLRPAGVFFSGFTEGYTATSVNSIAVQSDGKILVGGNFTKYITNNNIYECSNLVRLNTDGSLDAVYTGSPKSFDAPILTVAVDYSGRTIVGGQFTKFGGANHNYIMRFSSDTTVDTTFVDPGLNGQVNVIVPTPYHKTGTSFSYSYLVGGEFNNLLMEFDYDGNEILNGWNFATGTSVNTIALDTSTRFDYEIPTKGYNVYVGGFFTKFGLLDYKNIISFDSRANILSTFSGTSGGFNKPVYSIVVRPDNIILVGGEFTFYSGTTSSSMVMLYNDGQIYNTFDFNGYVNAIALDCCGKFLVGGTFTTVLSSTVNYIARFLPNGSQLDRTFHSDGFNNFVKTIYYSKS